MVKRISAFAALAVVLAVMCCVTAFADQHVYDNADLFTDAEEASLESSISSFISYSGQDMYVLTAAPEDDLYDSSRERADYFLLDRGYGNSDDGAILYLIDMCYRQDYMSTAGSMIEYITDYRRDDIFSETGPYLQNGDFAGAASAFVGNTYYWYSQGIPENQHSHKEGNSFTIWDVLITLVLAAAGFFVPMLVVKGKYELKGSTYNYDYRGNSKVNITGRSDQYLRTTVVRTPKHQDNGSDSGDSSTHDTGGGTFGGGSGNHF